jgi:hypothetical protein
MKLCISESGSHGACELGKMMEGVVGLGCYGLVLVLLIGSRFVCVYMCVCVCVCVIASW